jgi:hypothetical protein
MHVNVQKEKRTMTLEIDLTNLSATPSSVKAGDPINIVASVTSTLDHFQDEAAYRLFVFVCSCEGKHAPKTPIIQTGHLGDASWPTQSYDFNFTVYAGPALDLYEITAVLLEGGAHDTDSIPVFKETGPIVVTP